MNPSLWEKALQLLGNRAIPGSPSQQEKLLVRILELAASNGDQWVRTHRDALLAQWAKALAKGWIR